MGLYPFFSALNYPYATNTDWSSFVGDIKKYYIDTPKSLFADERKRKSLLRNLKFYGLGIITLAVIFPGGKGTKVDFCLYIQGDAPFCYQNPLHAPYCQLSRIISEYAPPPLEKFLSR